SEVHSFQVPSEGVPGSFVAPSRGYSLSFLSMSEGWGGVLPQVSDNSLGTSGDNDCDASEGSLGLSPSSRVLAAADALYEERNGGPGLGPARGGRGGAESQLEGFSDDGILGDSASTNDKTSAEGESEAGAGGAGEVGREESLDKPWSKPSTSTDATVLKRPKEGVAGMEHSSASPLEAAGHDCNPKCQAVDEMSLSALKKYAQELCLPMSGLKAELRDRIKGEVQRLSRGVGATSDGDMKEKGEGEEKSGQEGERGGSDNK
ncbi:unnamed protein product, partial [Discosporangium mesarthrocarpum]